MSRRKSSRRKPRRKTPRRKPKRKASRRKKSKKKAPFGGYAIEFTNRQETMEEIFGKKPVTPSQMTKILWKFIKRKRLARKP